MSEFTVKHPSEHRDFSKNELSVSVDENAMPEAGKYARHYSDDSFWHKIEKYGRFAGAKAAYHAILLWYVATKPSTPLPVKMLIFGGLGYFILPIDAVPDFLVGIGYGDDIAIILGIISAYSMHMDDESKAKARAKVCEIFGQDVAV
jgi:Uncharacterized conserved protein